MYVVQAIAWLKNEKKEKKMYNSLNEYKKEKELAQKLREQSKQSQK